VFGQECVSNPNIDPPECAIPDCGNLEPTKEDCDEFKINNLIRGPLLSPEKILYPECLRKQPCMVSMVKPKKPKAAKPKAPVGPPLDPMCIPEKNGVRQIKLPYTKLCRCSVWASNGCGEQEPFECPNDKPGWDKSRADACVSESEYEPYCCGSDAISNEQRSGKLGKNIYEPGTRNIIGHTSDAKKKQQEDKGGKGGILKSKAQRVSKGKSSQEHTFLMYIFSAFFFFVIFRHALSKEYVSPFTEELLEEI